jgi:hypothetical protein
MKKPSPKLIPMGVKISINLIFSKFCEYKKITGMAASKMV